MNIEEIMKELTLEEKAGLCSGRDFWYTKGVERLNIPPVMVCDGPHGLRKQVKEGDMMGINESIKSVCFPTASALAASFDRKLLKTLGETLGQICRVEQVAMLLGPGVNMKRSPLCGRNFEYFSEDPYAAGELAAAYVDGLQSKGIASCVKHFAVNNQETRRMSGSSQVDERTLREIYLPAFEKVVKKGNVRSVMCAYNALNQVFCAENKRLLQDILRKEWGFRGFVVTDWGAVKDRVKGIKAGLDLEMPGGPGAQDWKIVKAVQEGALEESVIDDAVRNILRFIKEYEENSRQESDYDLEKAHMAAIEIARECAVLLKNEDGLLPLDKEKKTAFIGDFANSPRYQGAGSSYINSYRVESAVDVAGQYGIVHTKGYDSRSDAVDEGLIEEAVRIAKDTDIAVIFAGLPDAYETEGIDRATLALPENQNRLIEAVAAVQPNTIVVLHIGSPVEMPWITKVKAVLNMYLAGEGCGRAAVDLLYGNANPGGKLAETFPCKLADNPSHLNFPGEEGMVEYKEGIYIGYRYYDKKEMDVLFPFGHGLSYTEFEYGELKLDRKKMKDTEMLTVSCKVRNIGNYPGKEVVQLYVSSIGSGVGRPVRELKEFTKVKLQPKEEVEIRFTLTERAFAYFETKVNDWFVESGFYAIEIGTSSRDIRLSGDVEVEGTKEIPITFSRHSARAELLKTEKGRSFMQQLMGHSAGGDTDKAMEESKKRKVRDLGKGSDKMVEQTVMQMPLSSLVTFGRMTEEELDGFLGMLNS